MNTLLLSGNLEIFNFNHNQSKNNSSIGKNITNGNFNNFRNKTNTKINFSENINENTNIINSKYFKTGSSTKFNFENKNYFIPVANINLNNNDFNSMENKENLESILVFFLLTLDFLR